MSGFEGFSDINEVDEDLEKVEAGLRRVLFAQDDEIIIVRDADKTEFFKQLYAINTKIRTNYANNQGKTLVWVYYGGHGVMSNTTYAVCNKAKERKYSWYPLEDQLRMLSQLDGAYVVGTFDCCRENLSPAMREGTETRGGLGEEGGELDVEEGKEENIVLTFGCAPNSKVNMKSRIAERLFVEYTAMQNSGDNNQISFPSTDFYDFLQWRPEDKGEHTQSYKSTAILNAMV